MRVGNDYWDSKDAMRDIKRSMVRRWAVIVSDANLSAELFSFPSLIFLTSNSSSKNE